MRHRIITMIVLAAAAMQFEGCLVIPPFGGDRYRRHRHFQPNKGASEVSVSYGVYSGTQLFNNLPSGEYGNTAQQAFTTGNIFATYRYYVTNRLSLGLTIGDQALQYDWYGYNGNYYGNNGGPFMYHQNVNLFTTALEMKNILVDFPYFQCYDLLGLGWTYRSESYTNVMPNSDIAPNQGMRLNVQVTPVGLRFGKALGGYLEFGIGYKGLVNTGMFYSFR